MSWGQRFFSVMSHRFYDLGLYSFVTEQIWGCSTARLLDNYVEHISDTHLEVGVGTGYFLNRTLCPEHTQRLVLLDLNSRCLAKSAIRLDSFGPQLRQHDICLPMIDQQRFKSVGINYVLHCVPGGIQSMRKVCANLHAVLHADGVLFGATVLDHRHAGWAARLMNKLLQVCGIFHNADHDLAGLRAALEACFSRVELQLVGNTAVFQAWK